jgi:hypothetical protein
MDMKHGHVKNSRNSRTRTRKTDDDDEEEEEMQNELLNSADDMTDDYRLQFSLQYDNGNSMAISISH